MASSLAAKRSFATLLLLLLTQLYASAPACHGAAGKRNITAILAASPNLREFSGLLTSTGLAGDIDRRKRSAPVTVLPVDDFMTARLKAPLAAIRRRLSLHVLTGCYYDGARLRGLPPGGSAVVSTLFPPSRSGAGGDGRMMIFAPGHGWQVRFLPMGSGHGVWEGVLFLKSVYGAPGDVSVLQVSGVMSAGTKLLTEEAAPSRLA